MLEAFQVSEEKLAQALDEQELVQALVSVYYLQHEVP